MIRSKVTSKSQTTLPKVLRAALDIGPGDEVGYIIEQGRAIMVKVTAEERDVALDGFLNLLEEEFRTKPRSIHGISQELVDRVNALTGGEAVDLDEPIYGSVSL